MNETERAFSSLLQRVNELERIVGNLSLAEIPLFWAGSKVGIATPATGAALQIAGSLRVGTNNSGGTGNIDGMLSIGDIGVDYTPTTSTWGDLGSTLLLNALNYSTIGFHGAGSRVDYIRVGGGLITLGYNAGWGNAGVAIPGQTAIGATAAQGNIKLYVEGQDNTSATYAVYVNNSTPSGLFALRNDGVSWVNQAWTVGSDDRLKDEIEPLPILSSKQSLLRLKPKKYKLKGRSKYQHGFTAQEMREVIPDLVIESTICALCGAEADTHTEDTDHAFDPLLGIQYEGLIPTLVATIQDQQGEINTLRDELAQLREQFKDLKAFVTGKPK